MTYYIGLMSGTSLDGVDAVLIQMDGPVWQGALAHSYLPYPDDIKTAVLALQQRGHDELHQAALLSQRLSRMYAQTVLQLLAEQGLQAADIAAVGCHGQTIRHAPELGYSLQIADWSLLAELTGIDVVGDFRSRDLAAGGQGAPLVPAFHAALFAHPEETRVLANIGGISNISVLRPDGPILGFDTGPGNMLMDAWTQSHFQQAYDADRYYNRDRYERDNDRRYRPVYENNRRDWRRGQVLDRAYRGQGYWVNDYRQYPRLYAPSKNQRWVRVDNDYILVNTLSNVIVSILTGR